MTLKAALRIALAFAALVAAHSALLCIPKTLFSYSVHAEGLILHSDRPFSEAAAKHVLDLTEAKLASSPLYWRQPRHDIFVCNSRWRQMLFFNKDYGVGGVSPYPLTANVFLREALIEDNRLVSPRGTPVSGDRTLDHFIALKSLTSSRVVRSAPSAISNCHSGCARDTPIMSARETRLTTAKHGALSWRERRKWIGRGPACTRVFTCWSPTSWTIGAGV
jgi:hypothetical protein